MTVGPACRATLKRVAARNTVGWADGPGFALQRKGAKLRRVLREDIEETTVLGAACSEVFSGPRLAKVLRPALELQRQAVEALEKNEVFEPLSIHTTAGFPRALGDFVELLEPHLPEKGDWFVNLQLEGATAVWAGVEALFHLRQAKQGSSEEECYLAVAEASYHGAKNRDLGLPALPRWPGAPRSAGQVSYPLPKSNNPKDNEAYLQNFDRFLAANPQIGVFLFEPQWGSSRLARTWQPDLLREVISRCHRAGAYVLCDEVMCGLGRHGQGALFLSTAWKLRPDAVTFGKSMASGTFPLSGVAVLHGGTFLQQEGARLVQSHTYAGASSLAYLTAVEVLKEIPNWFHRAHELGALVSEILGPCQDEDFFQLYGQGLLWGGEFLDSKVTEDDFQEACYDLKVWPYIVPAQHLGFMISPPMDIDEGEFRDGLKSLAQIITRIRAKIQNNSLK